MGIVVIGILAWIVQGGKIFNNPVAYEFTGTLQEYKDNIFTVEGIYVLEGQNDSDIQEMTTVKIIIEPDTKIIRTLLTFPTKEELSKTKGYFDADKLERVDSEVDLATFQEDASGGFGEGIFAKSNKNIAGKTIFTATELNYRTVIKPKTQ